MDEVIKSDIFYQEHTGEVTHRTTQPTEDIILERNSQLRNNVGAIRDLGSQAEGGTWGRQVASIPFIKYDEAIRNGYALNCKDQKVAALEMNRFLKSEEGRKCLVR